MERVTVAEEEVDRAKAVSYTHLDVYKRQEGRKEAALQVNSWAWSDGEYANLGLSSLLKLMAGHRESPEGV